MTYALAAEFLRDVKYVEDWGCGMGGFRCFCKTPYLGIDGSANPYVDKVVNLEKYISDADGILLRHVLEHNYRWNRILDNALRSFHRKMCLILFTPFSTRTKEIAYDEWIGVPDISFEKNELVSRFGDLRWMSTEALKTRTQYGVENVFYIWKSS